MFKNKKELASPGQAAVSRPASEAVVKMKPKPGIPSIISADMVITGNMRTTGDLQIEGEVRGDIVAAKLIIAAGGSVAGHMVAEDVRICGALTGTVHSPVVTLTSTGRVIGDIHHDLLTIETGGQLEGQSRRLVPTPPPVLENEASPEIPAEGWTNGETENQHNHEGHNYN
jgi:cytoskeletal protein CcmA (bactofilin family)